MANPEHLAILKQGVEAWKEWRRANPEAAPELAGAQLPEQDLDGVDLSHADLEGANFFKTTLAGASLERASFCGANLSGAVLSRSSGDRVNFSRADLSEAELLDAELRNASLVSANLRDTDLRDAQLPEACLAKARLYGTDLRRADLSGANLCDAQVTRANLCDANLSKAWLLGASLVNTDLSGADLSGCRVFGVATWNLTLDGATQEGLVISTSEEPRITVDNLELAQFIHMLARNEKMQGVIETVTSKVVLILGSFSKKRKPVLDALREELRKHDYVPVIFDFERPADKSIAGTVTTLAKLARFVIADVTDPSWVTVETQLVVRESRSVPFRLIKHQSASVPSPIIDLRDESPHLIRPFDYESLDHAVASVEAIVQPAEEMAEVIRAKRKAIEKDPW